MAEEPSAKRHRGETSDQSSNLDDVHVPGEKREYNQTLIGVEHHGKEMLEIVCTSKPDEADKVIGRLKMKGGGLYPSFIEVDVEYTSEDEPPRWQQSCSCASRNSAWCTTSQRPQNGNPYYCSFICCTSTCTIVCEVDARVHVSQVTCISETVKWIVSPD